MFLVNVSSVGESISMRSLLSFILFSKISLNFLYSSLFHMLYRFSVFMLPNVTLLMFNCLLMKNLGILLWIGMLVYTHGEMSPLKLMKMVFVGSSGQFGISLHSMSYMKTFCSSSLAIFLASSM